MTYFRSQVLGIRGKRACENQLMPSIMIYANLPVILSYFRREEEEYIRMILDQFRLKKYGHSIRRTTECFDMYLIFIAWWIYQ